MLENYLIVQKIFLIKIIHLKKFIYLILYFIIKYLSCYHSPEPQLNLKIFNLFIFRLFEWFNLKNFGITLNHLTFL